MIDCCLLCGKNNFKILHNRGILEKGRPILKFNNSICKNCGLVFLNPQPGSADYEKIYKEYENSRHVCKNKEDVNKMIDKILTDPQVAQIYDFVKDYLKDERDVLDIGCGFGQISNGFKNIYKCNVSAVEPSEILSEVVSTRTGVSVFCGGFDNFFESNNKKFNLLIMNHVFEHFTDPSRKFAQFKELLFFGGVVYIEVPNVVSFKKPVNHFFDYCHPFSYSPKTFKELVYKNDFKIIKVNKNKTHRLQIIIAPSESAYQDIGKDEYWDFGKYRDTDFYIKKRKLIDFLRKVKYKIYGY